MQARSGSRYNDEPGAELETVEFGGWVAEFDRDANRAAYALIPLGGAEDCGCLECRNFLAARDKGLVYSAEAIGLLERLGVDSVRESEVYGMGPSRELHGLYLYGGWFNVIGQLLGDEPPEPDTIGPEIQVFPMADGALPDPAFGDAPMFRVEFLVALPWLLVEPHWEAPRKRGRRR
jgi:hypothetical protein